MLTATGSRLFRFLLSIVIRLCRSTALALRARFASLWRSILTFAHRRGQSQIRWDANNDPVPVDSNPTGIELAKVEEPKSETLAVLPVWRSGACWQNELSKYQDHSDQFTFDPHPATPERGSQRYKPRRVSLGNPLVDIPAGQQKLLSALPPLPDGWRRYIHPEGNLFFYHEALRIFTENDVIRNEKEILFNATRLIQQAIQQGDVILDELTEIVLNMDDNQRWYYYFVDHRHRLLFWVQQVNVRDDLETDLQGITQYSHIKYLVETRYWYASSGSLSGMCALYIVSDMELRSHCEYYPHNRTLPKGVFEELRGMLNYTKTDIMTAHSSTSPFAQDELVAISDLVNSLKGTFSYPKLLLDPADFSEDDKISDPYSIWVISRLMAFFTENRFLNFCGQPCARLDPDASLLGQQNWNHSIVFKLSNVFLFWSLDEHAVRLQRVWVDGMIIQPRWKDFINRLTTELARYTIFSTVMLAVNFSFLAVPGVVPQAQGSPASSIQIIIYCSVVSTIASILFSLTLLNVYGDPELMAADPAADVMWMLSQTEWGMACFAIMHSLPNACLIWSIVLFSAALAVQIFGPKELPTVTTLGVECLILVLLGLMSFGVMRLLCRRDNVSDVDISPGN